MTDALHVLSVIALMAAVTFALRALPFIAGHWLRRHPLVHKLGEALPLAIMVLLTVDSLGGQARGNPAGGPWHELLAIALVVLLQWRVRQTLLSIVAGTALYVALRAL